MPNDDEIAKKVDMKPIEEIAEKLGIEVGAMEWWIWWIWCQASLA